MILNIHEDTYEHTEHIRVYVSVCYNILDIWGFEVTTAQLTNILFIPGWTSLYWDGVWHKPSCSSNSGTVYNKSPRGLVWYSIT